MQARETLFARPPSATYWICVALAPVIFLLAMHFADRAPSIDPAYLRTSALAIVSHSDQPPEFASDAAAPVELPHHTFVDASGAASVWYQIEVRPALTPQGLWGLYLPYTHGNFEIYVNGAIVGASAPMAPPYAYFRQPLYFEFSSSLLHPDLNTVLVRLVSVRFGAWMDTVYVGPSQHLQPAYEYASFLESWLMRATVVALIVMSMLMLGLVWVRPADTAHVWFAAANLCWAGYNWLLLEPRIPISATGLWFSLPAIALGWFSICSALFINRLPGCGGPRPRMERIFLAFGVLGAAAVVTHRMTSNAPSWIQLYVWLPGVMLINGYIVWRLLHTARRNPSFEVKLWLLAAVLTLVVGLRDYLWDENVVTSGSIHYLSYTVSLILIAFGLTLLSRITRALTEAETLNRELEGRVAAKGVELARNYERLRDLERERVISAERERMTTDMHDGIGGQLVHALALVESKAEFQPLESILRGALDDLRLIIDSGDPSEGNLLAVLSNFRARNERRVQQGGLRFLWQVTDLPLLSDFGPHKSLQVLRVLQEALTNVLKHARATQVTVATSAAQDDLGRATVVVDVIDDGGGYVAGNIPGRGVNNMRRRARELGGSIEFSTAPTGSRVRVILPVDPDSRFQSFNTVNINST
ncbi:MAG: sensor histidine kinase [Steroidobacter sp.]